MIDNPNSPRIISPPIVFGAMTQWFSKMIDRRGAPGFLVGLSGTDSLVAFCAAYKALEKAGKGDRMWGVHFAPSEDFLYDHPEAEVHLWFQNQVLPWLKEYAPQAKIEVNTSIDWRCDGQRWGALMDMSVVSNDRRRAMRLPEEQYWVVGTRNRTEDMLINYSNVSVAVSMQPLLQLWKSEILQLSEHLGIPQIAITKSCETDCICGRQALASNHIREVDLLLMEKDNELTEEYVEANIPADLRAALAKYIEAQIQKNFFKKEIPYRPRYSITAWSNDPFVKSFEEGTLNLKEFNHRKHLYVAWVYLKDMEINEAVSSYCYFLKPLLEASGHGNRYNVDVTRKYFELLQQEMTAHPTDNFDELMDKSDILKVKITA